MCILCVWGNKWVNKYISYAYILTYQPTIQSTNQSFFSFLEGIKWFIASGVEKGLDYTWSGYYRRHSGAILCDGWRVFGCAVNSSQNSWLKSMYSWNNKYDCCYSASSLCFFPVLNLYLISVIFPFLSILFYLQGTNIYLRVFRK